MPKWITWLDLLPVLIACMAVTIALVLGADPKEKRIKAPKWKILQVVNYAYQFRKKPFALSLPSLITLSSFVGLIALTMLTSMAGPQSTIEPSNRLISSPTRSPTPYSVTAIAAISFGPPTYTPSLTPTNTATLTDTPSPTPTVTLTSTPIAPTEIPTPTPTFTPFPRLQTPTQVKLTDTPDPSTRQCSSGVRIDQPTRDSLHGNDFAIVGNAYLPNGLSINFESYQVWLSQLDSSHNPLDWFLIVDSGTPVFGGELAKINLATLREQGRTSDKYAIRLRVVDNTGNYDRDSYPDCRIDVQIDLPED